MAWDSKRNLELLSRGNTVTTVWVPHQSGHEGNVGLTQESSERHFVFGCESLTRFLPRTIGYPGSELENNLRDLGV